MGWKWKHPWYYELPNGALMPVAGGPHGWWEHEMREALRNRDLAALVKNRPHLQGIEGGIANDIMLSLSSGGRARRTTPPSPPRRRESSRAF